MTDKINIKDLDLDDLKQKGLCILPWIHLHISPNNVILPCCIGNMKFSEDIVSTEEHRLIDHVNSDTMSQLRLDMLAGKRPEMCNTCYRTEKNMKSFRQASLEEHEAHIESAISETNVDGTLANFSMRYFDIRFRNICNMKCRTCGSGFSSQWEIENKKFNEVEEQSENVIDVETMLADTISHLPSLTKAYFAGGEPLVTEEHYILLEELIRCGNKNVQLIYNSNLSKLKFKDKDLLSLWKHFDSRIQFYASLDHYGARAEYIRSGTNWEEIVENYKMLYHLDTVSLNITTTVSMFNYASLDDFFRYMIDNDMYVGARHNRGIWQFNPVYGPVEISITTLPSHIKANARARYTAYSDLFCNTFKRPVDTNDFPRLKQQWIDFCNIAESEDTWDEYKQATKSLIDKIDKRRNESFNDTFPELRGIFD